MTKCISRFITSRFIISSAVLVTLLFVAVPAWSQAPTGTIAGIARDASGGVLPGVTVEASSPALIEGVRTGVTDGSGNYRIVSLRVGTYTVTFALPGFATVVREGIELSAGFTANVSADMPVGGLEETITVTGASPVVDVQNVVTQNVLTRETIDSLPLGRTLYSYAALTLGASQATSMGGGAIGGQDVGGSSGDTYGYVQIHGSRHTDGASMFDGMPWNNMQGDGTGWSKQYFLNVLAVEEVVITAAGSSAEEAYGGVNLNAIPKEGGNRFSTSFFTSNTTEDLQASNLTDDLRNRGLTRTPGIKKVYDIGGGLGGPIVKDKLWFYTAHRWWGAQTYHPGAFENATHGTKVYTPDLTKPTFTDIYQQDHTIRLTGQVAANQKLTFSNSYQRSCACNFGIQSGSRASDTNIGYSYKPVNLTQVTWTMPYTNRLLFMGGFSYLYNTYDKIPAEVVQPTDIAMLEKSTGLAYNATAFGSISLGGQYGFGARFDRMTEKFSVSYVTGSHSFKTGFTAFHGKETYGPTFINQSLQYILNLGEFVALKQFASPAEADNRMKFDYGIYAQDQWTVENLTLNLGIRFDHVNAYVPAQERPGGLFVPTIVIDRIENVPNYKDISPRIGAAYDLFGNGKTAVKFSLGQYVLGVGTSIAGDFNPATAIVTSAERTWTDANGNESPDCDLFSFSANGECGALSPSAFGTARSITERDPDLVTGWGVRQSQWVASAGIQHELAPGVGIDITYHRRSFAGQTVTHNRALTSADFDTFCITGPADARLPGGGNAEVCGLFDVKKAKFGLSNPLITESSNFGDWVDSYDGVDLSVFLRNLGESGHVQGGVSIGRKVEDVCFAATQPEISPISRSAPPATAGFCRVSPPWSAGTQVKFSGGYVMPYGVQLGINFQNLPGLPISAQYAALNDDFAPDLGRNLSKCPTVTGPCTATKLTDVFPKDSEFNDRLTQVDLRIGKRFAIGGARIEALVDLFNVFNTSEVTATVSRFGSRWLFPSQIMGGRLLRLGARLDF